MRPRIPSTAELLVKFSEACPGVKLLLLGYKRSIFAINKEAFQIFTECCLEPLESVSHLLWGRCSWLIFFAVFSVIVYPAHLSSPPSSRTLTFSVWSTSEASPWGSSSRKWPSSFCEARYPSLFIHSGSKGNWGRVTLLKMTQKQSCLSSLQRFTLLFTWNLERSSPCFSTSPTLPGKHW